jgi:hypothetical protein
VSLHPSDEDVSLHPRDEDVSLHPSDEDLSLGAPMSLGAPRAMECLYLCLDDR